MEFQVLLDAPAGPQKRIQIAKLGDFKDRRYGEFSINAANVANWQRNLTKLPGGEALIDLEHRSERKPRDSQAAGWITGINLDGNRVMADVNWTPLGKQKIEDHIYRFVSPVFGPQELETGEVLDEALPSVALTNKPFLGSMPAIQLASAERVSEALDEDPAARFHVRALEGEYGDHTRALVMLDVSQSERDAAAKAGHALPDGSFPIRNTHELHAAAVLAASGHGNAAAAKKLIRRRAKDLGVNVATLPGFADDTRPDAADSRRTMDTKTLQLLGLEADADDQTILDAVTQLHDKAAVEPQEPKTLEQQATDQGLVLLDAATVATMQRQSAAGEAAMIQLEAERFERAFETALSDPDGARVKPAEKEQLQHFYKLDAEATLKLIEDREPIVPARPQGAPAVQLSDDASPDQIAATGVHPDSHLLDQKIHAYLRDKGLPRSAYVTVLDQYAREEITF